MMNKPETQAEIQPLLRAGIAATKAGRSEQARQALMRVVEVDENNVQAWLWLSAVVDNPTDQLTCLENVLTLDPGNKHAQAGLARLKQDGSGPDISPPPQPAETTPTATQVTGTDSPPSSKSSAKPARDRRSSSSKYKRLSPHSSSAQASTAKPAYLMEDDVPEPVPAAPKDVFADKYLCPYCAAKTQPDDVRCKACGGELWLKVPKLQETSTLYKWVVGLQIFNLITHPVVTFLLFSAFVFVLSLMSDEFEFASLSSVPIGCASIVFLIHSILLIGLLQRWRPFFYLLLLSSILWLGCSGGAIAMRFSLGEIQSIFDLVYLGVQASLVIAQFFMVLNIGDDFTFDKYRILLEVDSGVKTGGDLLKRGQRYAERKMWGKAAIHFRQATYKLYENLETHLSLAVAYINLKLYDQAEKPLARARELSSGSFRVEKLQALLDSRREVENRSSEK
jgi:hypothetical protein